tara:strand:- start:1704 stop:1931 length:228 start_codon:yes stop_codon:yes gene_type:complete
LYYIREREIMETDRMSIKKKEKKTATKIVRLTETIATAIATYADVYAIKESEAMRLLLERGIYAESNGVADTRDY